MKLSPAIALALSLTACQPDSEKAAGISPQRMADALHTVLEADRVTYTKKIVNRLTIEESVIKASEHWQEEKALALPAQMFRMGAELVNEKNPGFSYALISSWAINKKNLPRTDAEKSGVEALAKEAGKPYYSEETLGGKRYFTALYPDIAVTEACIQCHNKHQDSPRNDFAIGDVMGAMVVRLQMD